MVRAGPEVYQHVLAFPRQMYIGLARWRLYCMGSMYCEKKVMHGWSIMPHVGADTYLFLASKLGSRCITAEEERVIQTDLRSILALEQGTPVAVGSGRSSLKDKLHACTHSVKLTSGSWSRACELMTRTCTWVGDLGEKSIARVKTNARKLIGQWVLDADAAADAANDDAFDIFDEDDHLSCFLVWVCEQ